jgi:hypothetical protein
MFCKYIIFGKLYYLNGLGDRGPQAACVSQVGEPRSK